MTRQSRPKPARLDDSSAFAAAYRAHARSILVFHTRRTYDAATALDLTAETFAQAFAGRRRFRGSSDDEQAAWLFGIARHVFARYARRGRTERDALARLGVEVPAMEPEEALRVIELAGLADVRAAVAREFDALPSRQKRALGLRVVDELPYPEVARRLGISEATARARVSRGLRALSDALDRRQIPTEAMR